VALSRTDAAQEQGRGVTLQTISVEVSSRRVATVLLNRPDRGNSFDQTMLDELASEFATLAADPHVRVIVLRGSGRHFCTGADLAARASVAPQQPSSASDGKRASLRDVLVALEALPKPTVAVVHGGAVGGGAAFVACCDIALATENAFFSIPEVRVGMAPLGVMPFLLRAIGERGLRRYALSGERFASAEALRLGLVHQVCEAIALDDVLARLLDDLLHGAPGAISEFKSAVAQVATPSLSATLANTPARHAQSEEAREGVASFREKRKPSWYPK
jgi:methylglutaconyl-CoA hydratase